MTSAEIDYERRLRRLAQRDRRRLLTQLRREAGVRVVRRRPDPAERVARAVAPLDRAQRELFGDRPYQTLTTEERARVVRRALAIAAENAS